MHSPSLARIQDKRWAKSHGRGGTGTKRKRALITGITGQDGSYLAELLLEKGYEVHGIRRRTSSFNSFRLAGTASRLFLHYGDLTDSASCMQIVSQIRPHEIYNLAAQSHVRTSFETSEYTGDVDALGVLRLLNAILNAGLEKTTRFYQASTPSVSLLSHRAACSLPAYSYGRTHV